MKQSSKHKRITLMINKIEYEMSLYFSFGDISFSLKFLDEGNDDYDFAVASIIKNHIISEKSNLEIDDIKNDKSALAQYIQEAVNCNSDLPVSYDKFSDEPQISARFIKSINDMYQESIKRIVETPLRGFSDIIDEYISIPQQIISNLRKAIESFYDFWEDIFENSEDSEFTAELKEDLVVFFENWGKYGWVLPNDFEAPILSLNPTNQNEANKMALYYYDDKYMSNLFSLMLNDMKIRKDDFEEAIFDFENGKYKSCSMILFSLIDGELISMQRDEDRNKKNNFRDSGKRAAINIKNRIQRELAVEIKEVWLWGLNYKNLFACLEAVFAGGDDFKEQPQRVNRNFIDHGMLTRKVTKTDCIQLFLLYYNFLDFFEVVEE